MLPFDPLSLDRDLARGARAARAFCRDLRHDLARAEQEHPLEPVRWVAGKTTFEALAELPPSDPMRDALRRWVFALAIVRIAREPLLVASRSWHARTIRVERPEPALLDARDVVARLLRERSSDRRRLLLDALASDAPRIARAERDRDEAEGEIASRMGVGSLRAMRLPCDPEKVDELARLVLASTGDLARSTFSGGTLADGIARVVARDVEGSWPVHFARFVESAFAATPLAHGVPLDPGAFPAALGASSLARALARFGAAYARAAAPADAPFALAHDPTDVHPLRRGALFGALAADPTFLRRALGLSRDAARSASRALAATLLAAVRLEAARTLVGDARTGARDATDALAAALHLDVPLPLAHVLPRTEPRAPARLLAALLATGDRAAMIERFDEDWFRNPHGLRDLRERDGTLAPFTVDAVALREAPKALASSLEALLA